MSSTLRFPIGEPAWNKIKWKLLRLVEQRYFWVLFTGLRYAKTCFRADANRRRPRSACASAQTDQDLCSSLTYSLDSIECINGKQMHGWHFAHAQGESEFVLFAHARRHVFALRGQNKVQTLIWCTAHAICSCLEFILLHFNSINLDGQVKYPCKRCRFRGVISKVSTQSVIVHYYYYYYYYDT